MSVTNLTNRLFIKCSSNGRPQVKIPMTGITNTQRLYVKNKVKDIVLQENNVLTLYKVDSTQIGSEVIIR